MHLPDGRKQSRGAIHPIDRARKGYPKAIGGLRPQLSGEVGWIEAVWNHHYLFRPQKRETFEQRHAVLLGGCGDHMGPSQD